MSIEAMKALAMLENEASRDLWATDLRRDAEAADISTPVKELVMRVVAEVSVVTGVLTGEIRGKSRIGPVVRARHFVWFKLTEFGLSASEIGRAFKADHTTVLHGVARVKSKLCPNNQEAA